MESLFSSFSLGLEGTRRQCKQNGPAQTSLQSPLRSVGPGEGQDAEPLWDTFLGLSSTTIQT